MMIAAYIDEFIMFCAGLWMTAVGLGYLPLPGNAANQPPWVTRLAGHFKWMGPLLLAIAIVLAIAS
jgi:fucose permease